MIDDLILKIHAAPLEYLGWASVATEIRAICDAERSALLRVNAALGSAPTMVATSLEADTVTEYFKIWAPYDVMYKGALQHDRIRPALVSTDEQLVSRDEYFSCAYYNEYLCKHDIGPQLNLCLTAPEPEFHLGPSALTLYRGIGKEPFSRDTASLLQRIAPHLATAARATWRIEALNAEKPLYQQALDAIRVPFLALDKNGRMLLVNSAAAELLQAQRWVRASRNILGASLQLAGITEFRRALALLQRGVGSTLLLTDRGTQEQAAMTVVPASHASTIRVGTKRAIGFLWIVPCTPKRMSVTHLGRLFNLTKAELLLLQRLVEGASLHEAARQLEISIHTARSQLKAVFRKSGRRTQGQLLALATRMSLIHIDD